MSPKFCLCAAAYISIESAPTQIDIDFTSDKLTMNIYILHANLKFAIFTSFKTKIEIFFPFFMNLILSGKKLNHRWEVNIKC